MLAQHNGHCNERKVFCPQVVKFFITWSKSPDENNIIGLAYTTLIEEHIPTTAGRKKNLLNSCSYRFACIVFIALMQ